MTATSWPRSVIGIGRLEAPARRTSEPVSSWSCLIVRTLFEGMSVRETPPGKLSSVTETHAGVANSPAPAKEAEWPPAVAERYGPAGTRRKRHTRLRGWGDKSLRRRSGAASFREPAPLSSGPIVLKGAQVKLTEETPVPRQHPARVLRNCASKQKALPRSQECGVSN